MKFRHRSAQPGWRWVTPNHIDEENVRFPRPHGSCYSAVPEEERGAYVNAHGDRLQNAETPTSVCACACVCGWVVVRHGRKAAHVLRKAELELKPSVSKDKTQCTTDASHVSNRCANSPGVLIVIWVLHPRSAPKSARARRPRNTAAATWPGAGWLFSFPSPSRDMA
jgi:hypothetical protein